MLKILQNTVINDSVTFNQEAVEALNRYFTGAIFSRRYIPVLHITVRLKHLF